LPYATLADWFCITEVEGVYSAVRTGSLYKTDTFGFSRVKKDTIPGRWRELHGQLTN